MAFGLTEGEAQPHSPTGSLVLTEDNSIVFSQRQRPRNEPLIIDGKYICTQCKMKPFDRRCEWNKHMDKHDRPYVCEKPKCSHLHGFTYLGALLRHQREVHHLHGGSTLKLFCHMPECKHSRHTPFTRGRDLAEHLRRAHEPNTPEPISPPSSTTASTVLSSAPLLPLPQRWNIPAILSGVKVSAFMDSGCFGESVISADFAKRHRLKINTDTRPKIRLADNRIIKSKGTVSLPFSFLGERTLYNRTFNVMARCAHDVTLGSQFLHETATLPGLKHFARRAKEITFSASKKLRMMLTGSPEQFMSGFINGLPVRAVPDTGSDAMVVSHDFAKRMGFRVHRERKYRVWLTLADGAEVLTVGMVMNAEWRFSKSNGLPPDLGFQYNLLVLENMPCDMVLSGEFLHSTQAFTADQQSSYAPEQAGFDGTNLAGFYCIQYMIDNNAQATPLDAFETEVRRRGKVEDEIDSMTSESQRKAAWVVESNLQSSYQSRSNATTRHTQQPAFPGLPPLQGIYTLQAAASNVPRCTTVPPVGGPVVPPAVPSTVSLAGNTVVSPGGVPVAYPTRNRTTPLPPSPAVSPSGNPAGPVGQAGRPAVGSKPITNKTKGRMQRWFRPNKP